MREFNVRYNPFMPTFFTAGHAAMARALMPEVAVFSPGAVVCVATGGVDFGRLIADALEIPLHALDIRYPFSRQTQALPRTIAALAWPVKELLYRTGAPIEGCATTVLPLPGTRVALVDDSASSGKTIAAALDRLERGGIPRADVLVAVMRCGRRARGVVDLWFDGARRLAVSRG